MKSATALAFRFAGAGDLDAVLALVQSAYRGEASRAGWTTEADFLDGQRTDAEAVLALLRAPDSRMLLAARGDELVACCHLQREGATCHFGMFAVRPREQGHGLGRAVLSEAERIARDRWRCTRMEMTVISIRAELIAWYERRGYVRTGRFKPFPYGDERFGIPRRPDLRFEVLRRELASASASDGSREAAAPEVAAQPRAS